MARRAKDEASAKTAPGTVPLKVVIEPSDETPAYYVNFAEIACSLNEFSLSCARIPAKLNSTRLAEAQASGNLVVEPIVQLILPPTVIPGLIRALTSQKDHYEKLIGAPIHDTGATK